MKTGEVIKYIRLSKKMKSKNVYTDILSRPAISRFEKGLSDTTSEKFLKIITNLTISLDEFYFIYNHSTVDDSSEFLSEYSQAFYLNDLTRLKELKRVMEQKHQLTNKLVFLHYSALTDLTISYVSNEKSHLDNLQLLKEYLLGCEEWTYYELVLFTNSLDFFPEDLILLLYKRTKEKLADFNSLNKYNNDVFSLILNILVVFITKHDKEKSSFFYQELKGSISATNNKMYEKTMLIYFNDLITMMYSKEVASPSIDKIIGLFDYLDMPLKKAQCTSLFEIVKNNIQTKE